MVSALEKNGKSSAVSTENLSRVAERTILIVDFCAQHRWQVVAVGILLAAAAVPYDVARFSITTGHRKPDLAGFTLASAPICFLRGISAEGNPKQRFVIWPTEWSFALG
jgi:hypothetical protein